MAEGTAGGSRPERTVFVCSCEGTMPLDERALAQGCPGARLQTARQLCRAELPRLTQALASGEVLVGCVQERAVFADAAAEAKAAHALNTVCLRETAGWSAEADRAGPKMAALLAAASVPMPPTPIVSYRSEGVTLIYGRDEAAIEAANRLKTRLNLTVLLAEAKEVMPPRTTEFPVVKGRISRASGHLGAFELVVDDYAAPAPSSRSRLVFGPARDGAKSRCDIILDLSGLAPLFPAPHKRPGYLRADPNEPVAVERAIFDAADLVGTFDRPRYVTFTEALCAHSRSRKTGCTRCLDLCPVGAIRPNGDHVAIDPMICAGCGSCTSVCPTGAASYALPPAEALLKRLRALLLTYRGAGGKRPVLLVHEGEHGEPLIEALARFGDGLPARVLPFAVNEVTALGLETIAFAFAYGAAELRILLPARPRHDLEALNRTLAVAETVLCAWGFGEGRVGLIEASDPDALATALASLPTRDGAAAPRTLLPMGEARSLARIGLRELAKAAPAPSSIVPLPERAPFGSLSVNAEGCTLCLSCVAACPTGALRDNPDRPALSFVEDACVQCGLCAATCPEKVITLVPRLNIGPDVATPRVIKEEEPFACIRCGKPFGVKSSIERVVAKLSSSHWMYAGNAANIDLMRMCESCRVAAVTETSGLDPYAGPPRPPILTGDDV